MHEIGHCIGLIHEHQRPDRTQFVSVNNANIQAPTPSEPNPAGNFVMDSTNCPLGRYDCGSIMHYGQTGKGKVVGSITQQTITIINTANCPAIGQRNAPSAGDIAAVRALYESIIGLAAKVTLADSSDRSPAIASDGFGRLFIAWKGSGNENLNVIFSTDGGFTFIGKHTSGETSDDAPALAGLSGRVFIAWTGEGDGELNFAQVNRISGPPESVSGLINKVTLQETSHHRPALAFHTSTPGGSRRTCLAWTGQGDGNLNIIFDGLGTSFTDKHTFDETSSHAPALASHDGELFIAWKGSGNENLNVARVDFSGTTVTGISNKITFGDTSDHSPSLTSQGGLLYLGWTGQGEQKLNLRFSASAATNCTQNHVFESDSSDDAPALALHNEQLTLAWLGSGSENLNVAKADFLDRVPPPVI